MLAGIEHIKPRIIKELKILDIGLYLNTELLDLKVLKEHVLKRPEIHLQQQEREREMGTVLSELSALCPEPI